MTATVERLMNFGSIVYSRAKSSGGPGPGMCLSPGCRTDRFPSALPMSTPAGGHSPMPRRNLYSIAMVAAVSLLSWQATQGAKPKDEMMELYGLFVDAVEQVEANYVRPVSRRELL